MSKQKQLTPEQFRKMQLTELDMLVEFDRVCRKHNIDYVLFGGSLLGAVRHKGYIPWDDDADICMLREDYDRFRALADELDGDICFFQDHDTDPEYRWGYGKLRRTGSEYIRVGQEHLKCKTGIFVDIFPEDDIPRSLIGQLWQNFYCFCLRKILWSEVAKYQEKGFWRLWFTMLSRISPDAVYRRLERYTKKSRNDSPNRVRCLLFPATGTLYRKNPIRERYGMPKSWFQDRAEYEFEGHMFYSTRDYDTILTYIYGDYMTPPPEDKRQQHSPFSKIVFPDERAGKSRSEIAACGEEWSQRITEYIGSDYDRCPYLYLDLLEYGFSSEQTKVFAQTAEGELTAVMLQYQSCLHVFARSVEAADIPALARFIRNGGYTMVYCVRELAEALEPLLTDAGFRGTYGWLAEIKDAGSFGDEAVVPAEMSDFHEIAALLYADEDIGRSYTLDSLEKQLTERWEQGFGRNRVIREDGHVVAHGCTNAEYGGIVIVGELIVEESCRRRGLGKRIWRSLCGELLAEGKKVYSIYYSEASRSLHRSLGFEERCAWGKLVRETD